MHIFSSLDILLWITITALQLRLVLIGGLPRTFHAFLLFELIRSVGLMLIYIPSGYSMLYFWTLWTTAFVRDAIVLLALWESAGWNRLVMWFSVCSVFVNFYLGTQTLAANSDTTMVLLRTLERASTMTLGSVLCAALLFTMRRKVTFGLALWLCPLMLKASTIAYFRVVPGIQFLPIIGFIGSLLVWDGVRHEAVISASNEQLRSIQSALQKRMEMKHVELGATG